MAWGLGGCGCGHTNGCGWCEVCEKAGKKLTSEEYMKARTTLLGPELKKLIQQTRRAGRNARLYSKSNEAIAKRLQSVKHVKEVKL